MANSNNHRVERRIAFLEKVYLEDRKRWAESEAHWRKNDARMEAILRKLVELERRTDATLRLVLRHIEK